VTLDELRNLSSVMFGNRYRLELVAALALAGSNEGICLTLLAAECGGLTSSVYYPSIRALLSADLARRVNMAGGERRVLYFRIQGPTWRGVRHLVEDLQVDIDLSNVVRPVESEAL
jgi:hypothetical protein